MSADRIHRERNNACASIHVHHSRAPTHATTRLAPCFMHHAQTRSPCSTQVSTRHTHIAACSACVLPAVTEAMCRSDTFPARTHTTHQRTKRCRPKTARPDARRRAALPGAPSACALSGLAVSKTARTRPQSCWDLPKAPTQLSIAQPACRKSFSPAAPRCDCPSCQAPSGQSRRN